MAIGSLCRQYTDLTDDEISVIVIISASLQLLANLEDADAFIDCPCKNGDAIVVAEAKPSHVSSSYERSVVGLIAKPEDEPAVARTIRLGVATKRMKALTQESAGVIQSVEPIRNESRIIGVLIIEKRIDEQNGVKECGNFIGESDDSDVTALMELGKEHSWLSECIDEALILVDRDGVIVFRNSLAQELYTQQLGHTEDVLGQLYENIRLTDLPQLGSGGYSTAEVSLGKHFLTVKYIRLNSPNAAFAVMMRDITGIKEKEKELILRSVAIKEMHHRVKNNLQTIASLLRLQIRRSGNEDTRSVLRESMNRILSIAATHELLSQSGIDQVNIREVIANIKCNAMRHFSGTNLEVNVSIEGDDFEVDSDIATSVALVINELLQNSMKYAFVNNPSGNIKITVTKGGLYSQIRVIDDGGGFNVSSMQGNSLGFSIVQTLVGDKLHGDLNILSDEQGTTVTFSFKNSVQNIKRQKI